MRPSDATQMLPKPAWDDPRVHLLDDLWLLTIFAILLAIALPWFVSAFDVDIGTSLWGLLALGAIHVAFASLAAPTRPRTAWKTRGLGALNAVGILVLGFVWYHSGGLQNPMFLLVFALPVIGAVFISRWQPYFMAALAVLVVAAVALSQAPELRWYATSLNTEGAWLASVFGRNATAVTHPFPGFYAPSGYFVVLLQVFGVLLFACAVAAEHLGSIFERLYAHVSLARAEAERGQELWATLIEQLPVPALLVDADSLQVICASDLIADRLGESEAPLPGRSLFECVRFSFPEIVHELVAGVGGTAPLTAVRLRDALRMMNVSVRHVPQKGRRFALVLLDDVTDDFCLKAALDAADHAALVIDSRGYVLGFNKHAPSLFAETSIGADAARLLARPGMSARWWEPGLSGRCRMHVEISPRLYQVTSSAIALPGEEERIFVLAFLPVARSSANDQADIESSRITSTRVQPP